MGLVLTAGRAVSSFAAAAAASRPSPFAAACSGEKSGNPIVAADCVPCCGACTWSTPVPGRRASLNRAMTWQVGAGPGICPVVDAIGGDKPARRRPVTAGCMIHVAMRVGARPPGSTRITGNRVHEPTTAALTRRGAPLWSGGHVVGGGSGGISGGRATEGDLEPRQLLCGKRGGGSHSLQRRRVVERLIVGRPRGRHVADGVHHRDTKERKSKLVSSNNSDGTGLPHLIWLPRGWPTLCACAWPRSCRLTPLNFIDFSRLRLINRKTSDIRSVMPRMTFRCSQLATAVAAPRTTETMSNDDPSIEDSPRYEGGEDGNKPAENAEDALDAILRDPSKKAALLRKLGLDEQGRGSPQVG